MKITRIPAASAEALICPPGASVREAMRRLNAAPFPMQLIVEPSGKLIGAMTDGDIRRSLLRPDMSVENPVTESMQRNLVIGKAGAEAENLRLVQQTKSVIPFLPVVNEAGDLVEILVGTQGARAPETALVMAGGFGRRLGTTTRMTPKPLLQLGTRPILDHILEQLETAGIKQVYIAVHYLAEQFEAFIKSRDNCCNIELLHEREPLGTAGALGLLPASVNSTIIVLNGDIVTSVDFNALSNFHNRNNYDGTIAVAQHEVEIPYGVVRHSHDGIFEGIDEKPRLRQFVAAGLYLINPEIRALAPRANGIDMPELLNLARSVGLCIGLFPVHEHWMDIGRPQDLEAARTREGKTVAE